MRQLTVRAYIGVKRMGALDEKPFQKLAKGRYPAEEADEKAAELCSLWEEHLGDSAWHPIKVIVKDGTPKVNNSTYTLFSQTVLLQDDILAPVI